MYYSFLVLRTHYNYMLNLNLNVFSNMCMSLVGESCITCDESTIGAFGLVLFRLMSLSFIIGLLSKFIFLKYYLSLNSILKLK